MSAVLVIDDDAAIALALTMILTDEGYTTIAARDGVEGLELLRRNRIDLIITDVMMPRMSGPELVDVLRQEGNAIPVVLISAGARDPARMANAVFLRKPFDVDELLQTVEQLLPD